ncbi:hypothetical protein HY485_02835 [Candidatus Woesearchaeota archaeon]|nr:hypothetical protein [Candidatus Woesearchaeota archaeon]
MPEYKTIEAKIKSVEGFAVKRFFERSKYSGKLEIELEPNDSPVQYVVMDEVFPLQKGDFVSVMIDVFAGYVSHPQLSVNCRELSRGEKAAVIKKRDKDNEVVATYHGDK